MCHVCGQSINELPTVCPGPRTPRELPEVSSHETWAYKGRQYYVVKVRDDIRIQFNDKWEASVFYRIKDPDDLNEAALKFVRAKSDFTGKFRKVIS